MKTDFLQALSIYQILQDKPSSDEDYDQLVEKGISIFKDLLFRIETLNLFHEDVSPTHLKYLLVYYYLSEVYQKSRDRSFIKLAQAILFRFLSICIDLGYLNKTQIQMTEAFMQGKPLHMTREDRIAYYKRHRELEEKCLLYSFNLSLNKVDDEEFDEDLDQELLLETIQFIIQKSFSCLDMIQSELMVLAQKESYQPDTSKPPPLKPFILTSKREQFAKKVFGYSHNLPTMTIDEYLQREMDRGNFLQGGTQPAVQVDEDDMDACDAATYKARQWDEFTDHNPKGWGNRHNKG